MRKPPIGQLIGNLTGMFQPKYQAPGPTSDRLPFDMSKMEYETARKQKRRQLLKWSLPVVLVVFLVALWFLLPTPLTAKTITNYKHGSFATARRWIAPLTWTSPQPFVADFDSGTVDTKLGKYVRAQDELTRALTLAKPAQRCMVLQNLVYSLDAHATSLTAQFQDVTAYTTEVTNLKANNPKCFPAKQTLLHGGGGGGGGGGSVQSPAQQIVTQAQEEQLQQKNDQGQQTLNQGFEQNTLNQNNPNVKPW